MNDKVDIAVILVAMLTVIVLSAFALNWLHQEFISPPPPETLPELEITP
jgi:hypothetical protein